MKIMNIRFSKKYIQYIYINLEGGCYTPINKLTVYNPRTPMFLVSTKIIKNKSYTII